MAIYSVRTNRTQEIGLSWSYDQYALEGETKEQFFQRRIDESVTNPMYTDYQRAQSVSFDQSFNTVPETEQPAAKSEIEGVITSHGGTIIPAGPPTTFIPPAQFLPPVTPLGSPGGAISVNRGESSIPVQDGAGTPTDAPTGGRDGS